MITIKSDMMRYVENCPYFLSKVGRANCLVFISLNWGMQNPSWTPALVCCMPTNSLWLKDMRFFVEGTMKISKSQFGDLEKLGSFTMTYLFSIGSSFFRFWLFKNASFKATIVQVLWLSVRNLVGSSELRDMEVFDSQKNEWQLVVILKAH